MTKENITREENPQTKFLHHTQFTPTFPLAAFSPAYQLTWNTLTGITRITSTSEEERSKFNTHFAGWM